MECEVHGMTWLYMLGRAPGPAIRRQNHIPPLAGFPWHPTPWHRLGECKHSNSAESARVADLHISKQTPEGMASVVQGLSVAHGP